MREKRTPIQTGANAHSSLEELAALSNDAYVVHRFADERGWASLMRGFLIEHEPACLKTNNPRLVSPLRCDCDCRITRRVDSNEYAVAARYSDFLTKRRTKKAKR
jgi:hypothetical protein